MKDKINKKKLGKMGEDFAAGYLEKSGLQIIQRNFATRRGEIDIIAVDGDEIVFMEVKTRTNTQLGKPEEAIDEAKISKIRQIAREYLAPRDMMETPVRFDVMAIVWNRERKKWQARWIKRAF